MALKQADRVLNLATPLGDNVLLLTAFQGREEMSRLFSFELELISDNNAITPQDLVGQNVTFTIEYADGERRYFNGFVSRFYAGDEDEEGRRNYRAEVVPWLWFLTRTSDCRIFQQKTVTEIIEQIFGDLGFSDFDMGQVKGNHPKREYCVQYRETDFNFISRLMEEEGIFYFFVHEDGKHTLVLADNKNAYGDCAENEVAYPRDVSNQSVAAHISRWEHRYEFRTGKWAQTDYNFETPSTSLMSSTGTVIDLPGNTNYEHYDYPGDYLTTGDGDALTKIRMEEDEVEFELVRGESGCRSFSPGGKFKITEHRAAAEEGKTYVLTAVHHSAVEPKAYETGEPVAAVDYTNTFTCIPDSVVFRPARITRKPVIQGVQTAEVVGPPGEEIYPDKYGRVKVQFHWDREGQKDENSSCWIRVSQTHAGKGWGVMNVPRIGEEVVVSFLEGDPDRPLITGRVYHAENMPPYELPGSKNLYGMKSNSTKGGGGYNEYVFDDTKDNELIREHGQYDKESTIEHDLREQVLNNRSRDVGVDESISIGNNRTITVGGKHTETIEGDTTIRISTGNLVHAVETGTAAYTVQGDVTEKYHATQKTTVANEIEVTSNSAHIHLTASTDIKLSVGSSELLMKSDGSIKLSGVNIAIDGSQSVNIHGASVTSQADADHNIKGAIVLSEGSGTNTIKGGMVMLNP